MNHKFEEYVIKKFGFQKRIIVQLVLYKKSKSKKYKPLGEVYGPEKVLDKVSLARKIFTLIEMSKIGKQLSFTVWRISKLKKS